MSDETLRSIDLARTDDGRYEVTNRRGGVLRIGTGEDDDFTPVELLLSAIAGCAAIDIGLTPGTGAPPDTFDLRTAGNKVRDDRGNHLVDLQVVLDVRFPEGEEGDRAREALPRAIAQTRDRLCTVGRTVAIGEPITYVEA